MKLIDSAQQNHCFASEDVEYSYILASNKFIRELVNLIIFYSKSLIKV